MNLQYDFSGEVLAVTGGASGIGAGICKAFAVAGGTVVCLDVNQAQLDEMEAWQREHSGLLNQGQHSGPLAKGRIECRYLDVADPEQVNVVFKQIMDTHGRLDGLILSAAIQPRTEIEHMSDEEWQRVMAVNLNGAFYCTRAAVPIMREQRNGSMVTLSSGLATQGWPLASAYATTKAGLYAYTRSLARELLPHRVRVNILAPGVTDSPLFTGPNTDEEQAYFRRRGGAVGTVEDVVKLLLFLVSDASASLTGALINRELIFSAE